MWLNMNIKADNALIKLAPAIAEVFSLIRIFV